MKKCCLIFLLLVTFHSLFSQDVHFSQFGKSYLNLNPALAGSFNGDYRFNANYRNQWAAVAEPFTTLSVSAEAKSPIKQFPELNFGLSLINDEAGLGGLTNTQILLTSAYPLSLNTDSSFILKVGIQTGYSSRRINFDQFTFDQQYNGRFFEPSRASGEVFDRNSFGNFVLNSGIALEHNFSPKKKVEYGFSLFNLVKQNQGFKSETIPLESRVTLFAKADYIIASQLDLLPAILYSSQNNFKEFLVGSELRYRFQNQSSFVNALYGGLFVRPSDAVIVTTGFDYNFWNFGISYDINTSDLTTATNRKGGLELSVTYIFKSFKPTNKRFKACPSFM